MKRILLFIATQVLMIVSINIIYSFLVAAGLVPSGEYGNIIVLSVVIGFTGSFMSLFLSKFIAKSMMGVQIVEGHGPYGALVQKVHFLARRAGLDKMPEVGIYDSPEVNAFATGPSRNNSLVAVSTGLLNNMDSDEVEGVLAHEVSHIANGDMVTMTIVQGVINAVVYFITFILVNIIQNAMRGDSDRDPGIGSFFLRQIIFNVLYTALSFAAYPVIAWFSRYREYRADEGGAKLAGKEKMIAALERLKTKVDLIEKDDQSIQAMKISNRSRFGALFSTHPPLAERIEALRRS